MKDEILTIAEASTLLKLSDSTIRRWIKTGKLPAFRIGRKYRIRIRDIDKNFKLHKNVVYKDE